MTCTEILPLIEDYLDESLSPGQAEQVKQHLIDCESCRNDFDNSRRLKKLLREYSSPEPGKKYWSEIITRILSHISKGSSENGGINYGIANIFRP